MAQVKSGLMKIPRGRSRGIRGAAGTAKSATARASETLSKDVDKDALAKLTDSSIEKSVDYLKEYNPQIRKKFLRGTLSS